MILRAKYVIPIAPSEEIGNRAIIENGLVEIAESRIVDVRPAGGENSGGTIIDCGAAVLLPGLVNAHTHLELSHLAGRIAPVPGERPGAGFVGWLERLLGEIRRNSGDAEIVQAAVNTGAEQSLRAGVTTVGDITRNPRLTRAVLRDGRLRVVSFGEVIALGTLHDVLGERLEAAADRSQDSARLTAAVSPHAPYTCDRRALRACKETAARAKLRLAIHLAESLDEEACLTNGDGPLVEFLRSVGVWDDSVKVPQLGPVEYAERVGLLGPRTLLAHANYVNDADVRRIAQARASVAYCPRTHAAFGHPPHRFGEMLAAGINVCVGTDSLASNPSLSVLDELRFLRRASVDLENLELLRMGTMRGAKALGLGNTVGSLAPGKQADMAVFPLDPTGSRDPLENLLCAESVPIQVYVAGKRVDLPGARR